VKKLAIDLKPRWLKTRMKKFVVWVGSIGPHSPMAETEEFAIEQSDNCKRRLCGFTDKGNLIAALKSFWAMYALCMQSKSKRLQIYPYRAII